MALRERRKQIGLDQVELARRVGVSRQWIVEMERGKPRSELHLVLKTIDTLGLRLRLDDGSESAGDSVPPPPDIDEIVARARRPRR